IPRPDFNISQFRNFAIPSLSAYPHQFWHIAEKPGYSGTALLSKEKPLSVTYDFCSGVAAQRRRCTATPLHPKEGRVITAEFADFTIVTAYVPNSKDGLSRLPYRMKWDAEFCSYLNKLKNTKPVYVCGDFNCAHNEIDLANPDTNHMSAGFTDEERAGFSTLLESGFTDTFRAANPDTAERYTWWSFRTNARERNVGWRIDYWLASHGAAWSSPQIHDDIFGSDHCPVGLTIDD
ncbi:MAG: exodeoxyribonuclease III, partial [Kiritimatiellaeota bacterium]|nr:exodeoxyribonuclease III [Kiritimatiellota bacterium]